MPVDSPVKKTSYVQKLKQQIIDDDFDVSNQSTTTTPTKKSNIIDFATEKAKRTRVSFSSPLTSSQLPQSTDSFFSLEQLNPQTAIAFASIANGLQKEQFLDLLSGPLKNVLLTAAKIPSYDSRAIEKFSRQVEQEYEQFYQKLANEYKPSLADAKFKEQARQIIFSDQEISRLGEEISQTTRDLIDSTQPETFIQNYFQKKSGAFSSSSQTEANSIKEDTFQQKKAQGELAAEKDLSKETETKEELSSANSSIASTGNSSSSRSKNQESISSETASSSTSSAISQSSSPRASSVSTPSQISSPAEEPVSTEKKPSRLQQIRQVVQQQARIPQEAPSLSEIPAAVVSSKVISAPTPSQISSPAEEPVSTEKKPSRLQQIRQVVQQQARIPQEAPSTGEAIISPETTSLAVAAGTIAIASPETITSSPSSAAAVNQNSISPVSIPPTFSSSSTGAPTSSSLNPSKASLEPATSSPVSPAQTPISTASSSNAPFRAPLSSQKRSPLIRQKAFTSQTKNKLSPQNYLRDKAKNVSKKFIQKVIQILGQFFASILPYIWPVLLGLGVLVAGAALASGGIATVVGSGTAIFTAVTAWVSSTFGPFDSAAVQLANQSPLVDKTCAQCLTITKTVALKGGLDKTGEAISANNAKRAYFTYTLTPNTKECDSIELNGECSDLISVACKNVNSDSCPGLDPINYQVPEPLTTTVVNSAATKAIPTNYALTSNTASGVSENGNLDVSACNALMRILKTDNLHNYPLTEPVTFNLEEFLPDGYPLPYGDDYRLDNTFTLGYSGQPTNQHGTSSEINVCTSSTIIANAPPIIPSSSENIIWSAESATLKSWISQKDNYKLTRIWLSSPGKQINKFGSLFKEYAVNMASSAISNNNLSGKIFIATDASGFHNETAFGKVIITNGQILRDDQSLDQGDEGKIYHYYTFDSNGTLNSYKNTTSSQDLSGTYCAKNTFAFYPPMIENNKRSSFLYSTGEDRMRESFCQIDTNNYALITGQMDLDDVAQIMLKLNCKTGVNFDGGGSTCLYTKDSAGTEKIIFGCTSRKIPDILYFNEL